MSNWDLNLDRSDHCLGHLMALSLGQLLEYGNGTEICLLLWVFATSGGAVLVWQPGLGQAQARAVTL